MAVHIVGLYALVVEYSFEGDSISNHHGILKHIVLLELLRNFS